MQISPNLKFAKCKQQTVKINEILKSQKVANPSRQQNQVQPNKPQDNNPKAGRKVKQDSIIKMLLKN